MNFNEFNNQDEFNNIEQNLDDVYNKYSSYSENELINYVDNFIPTQNM